MRRQPHYVGDLRRRRRPQYGKRRPCEEMTLICRICGYPLRIVNDAFAVQEIPKGVNMLQVGHASVSDWHRIIFVHLFRIACCSVLIPKRSMPKRRHVRQFAL
jgi:hypothetical protein